MSKYTKSAKGQECQVRIPNVCNHDPETTVFAHVNGGGMGYKRADIHGAYACRACHDVLDGRDDAGLSVVVRDSYFFGGLLRTQEIMIKDGILLL